jgi:hypothetical protein
MNSQPTLWRKSLGLVAVAVMFLAALAVISPARSATDQIAPAVVETTPQAGQELATTAAIGLFFNVPMDQPSVEAAFSSVPAVAGTFSWPDAQTIIFTPNAALARAERFIFRVNENAKRAI